MKTILAGLALLSALAFIPGAEGSVSPDVLQRTQGAAHDPDWPCIQRKVPALSVAGVWAGPPVDEKLDLWQQDSEIRALVAELASRRVPIEDAMRRVKEFAAGLAAAERADKLALLFAGLFQTLDRERGEIIVGIERYARKQVALAEAVRQAQAEIGALASQDPQRANALNEQLLVQIRIFDERRQSLAFVCETPLILEQRLFELSRAIQAELPEAAPSPD
jgi:hypothetical protein